MGNKRQGSVYYGILTITILLTGGISSLRAVEFHTQGVVVDGRTIEQMVGDYMTNVFTWPDSPRINNGGPVYMKNRIIGSLRKQTIPADTFLLFGSLGTIEWWDPSLKDPGCDGFLQMSVEDVDRRLESANLELSFDGIPLNLDFEAARISIEHDVLEPTDDVDNPLVRCAASSNHYWLISPMEAGVHTVAYNSDLSGELVTYEFTVLDGLIGDLDRSGALDAADIEKISVGIRSESVDLLLDVDRNNVVNAADRSKWVKELANTDFGDANLDGVVSFPDFLTLSSAFGGEGGWGDGDFDGDGTVAFPDFLFLSANFGNRIAEASAVPEPAGTCLSMLGFLGLMGFRRRR